MDVELESGPYSLAAVGTEVLCIDTKFPSRTSNRAGLITIGGVSSPITVPSAVFTVEDSTVDGRGRYTLNVYLHAAWNEEDGYYGYLDNIGDDRQHLLSSYPDVFWTEQIGTVQFNGSTGIPTTLSQGVRSNVSLDGIWLKH